MKARPGWRSGRRRPRGQNYIPSLKLIQPNVTQCRSLDLFSGAGDREQSQKVVEVYLTLPLAVSIVASPPKTRVRIPVTATVGIWDCVGGGLGVRSGFEARFQPIGFTSPYSLVFSDSGQPSFLVFCFRFFFRTHALRSFSEICFLCSFALRRNKKKHESISLNRHCEPIQAAHNVHSNIQFKQHIKCRKTSERIVRHRPGEDGGADRGVRARTARVDVSLG